MALSLGTSQGATIIRNFTGGAAPGTVAGGGNLAGIFNTAADYWEAAILDTHTLTINFGWAALGGSTLGQHALVSEGGTPHRETAANIIFDNDGSSTWFLDPTPTENSEWSTFTENTSDYGGGSINDHRRYTGASGFASGRSDLLSVALHEIGHALGLSSANNAFVAEAGADRDVDITTLGFAGSVIPISASSAHVNVGTALMFPSISSSVRNLITGVDVLANAGISQFTSVNFNPLLGATVPEPGTTSCILIGVLLIRACRRPRQL